MYNLYVGVRKVGMSEELAILVTKLSKLGGKTMNTCFFSLRSRMASLGFSIATVLMELGSPATLYEVAQIIMFQDSLHFKLP